MTNRVIAAIDNSATAGRVIDAALSIAPMFNAEVEAVHIREDGVASVEALAKAAKIPLRLLDGSPTEKLIDALKDSHVLLGVLGIRRTAPGRRLIGHLALDVVQRTSKPVVAVPPGSGSRRLKPLQRVLVPLDGTMVATQAVENMVRRLRDRGVQLLALHVFDAKRMPRFSDQPQHEVDVWEREFLARYCQPGTHLHTRRGWAASAVLEVAATEKADLIALGWGQDLSPGKAAVVREVLGQSMVPVMLLPLIARRKPGAIVRPANSRTTGPVSSAASGLRSR